MNVSTISVPKEIALQKLSEYAHVRKEQRVSADRELRRLYKWASTHTLINVHQALRETGLNDQGLPKLALARANWETCFYSEINQAFSSSNRHFTSRYAIKFPSQTFPHTQGPWRQAYAPVPHIPPTIRPEGDLSNYHILFEVKEWKVYPADPFLLKQIYGWIFAILGEWDLTDLERSILSGLRS